MGLSTTSQEPVWRMGLEVVADATSSAQAALAVAMELAAWEELLPLKVAMQLRQGQVAVEAV
jgi:hypothetical protein